MGDFSRWRRGTAFPHAASHQRWQDPEASEAVPPAALPEGLGFRVQGLGFRV